MAPRSRRLRTIESLTPVSIMAIRGPGPALEHLQLGRRHLPGQVAAVHRRLGRDQLARLGLRDAGREDPAAHRPEVADVAHQRARVDAGDRRDPAVVQPGQPAALGARRVLAVDRRAHDGRAGVDPVGLHRLRGDAVVADVRVREGDQLTRVAGVAHRLLIARHRGREDDLADGVRVGSAGQAVKARPVLEQHVGGALLDHEVRKARSLGSRPASVSIRSRWAIAPAAMVSATRPWSVRPWKQQLADLLA